MRDFPDEAVAMTGVKGPLSLEDVLFAAAKATRIAPTQVLRADRVVSPEHLRSAAMHAHRAFAEGRNQAERLEVEFTRYTAGERQIRKAVEKMGIPDGCPEAVVVSLGDKRKDACQYFVHYLGLPEDDGLLDGGDAALTAFGITPKQRTATTPNQYTNLVLEAVAAVDLMR